MSTLFEKPFMLSMGPQRAGAHFVYDYLRAREDVCLPAGVKEIFFFDRHFQRGSAFYAHHFLVRERHQLVSEVSTTAFDHPDAPQRVFDLFGEDVALVCPLRHPVERALAVYEDYLRYGIVSGGIEEAVQQAPQILFSSRYAAHLKRWFQVFGQDNITFLFYEQAEKDIEPYLRTLCAAAGLSYTAPERESLFKRMMEGIAGGVKSERLLPGGYKKSRHAARVWLEHALEDEVGALEALLGDSVKYWNI